MSPCRRQRLRTLAASGSPPAAEAQRAVDGLPFHRPWTIEALVAALSLARDRPITIGALVPSLGQYCTALWVASEGVDRIYVRDDLTHFQREVAIAHELGHILLQHTLTGSHRLDYLQHLFPLVPARILAENHGLPCSPLTRSAYDHPFEQQAEWFARLLVTRADEYRQVLVPAGASPAQRRMLENAAKTFGWA